MMVLGIEWPFYCSNRAPTECVGEEALEADGRMQDFEELARVAPDNEHDYIENDV